MGGVKNRWFWKLKCNIEKEIKGARFSYWGNKRKALDEAGLKWDVDLSYTRMSKARSKEHPPTPPTVALYTLSLTAFNHLSCPDILSESYPMISHTICMTPYEFNHAISSDIATPHTTTFPYEIIAPPLCHFLRVFQFRCLSVLQLLWHPPNIHICWIPSICITSSSVTLIVLHRRVEWYPRMKMSEPSWSQCSVLGI